MQCGRRTDGRAVGRTAGRTDGRTRRSSDSVGRRTQLELAACEGSARTLGPRPSAAASAATSTADSRAIDLVDLGHHHDRALDRGRGAREKERTDWHRASVCRLPFQVRRVMALRLYPFALHSCVLYPLVYR